jgi:hypothetical protein
VDQFRLFFRQLVKAKSDVTIEAQDDVAAAQVRRAANGCECSRGRWRRGEHQRVALIRNGISYTSSGTTVFHQIGSALKAISDVWSSQTANHSILRGRASPRLPVCRCHRRADIPSKFVSDTGVGNALRALFATIRTPPHNCRLILGHTTPLAVPQVTLKAADHTARAHESRVGGDVRCRSKSRCVLWWRQKYGLRNRIGLMRNLQRDHRGGNRSLILFPFFPLFPLWDWGNVLDLRWWRG